MIKLVPGLETMRLGKAPGIEMSMTTGFGDGEPDEQQPLSKKRGEVKKGGNVIHVIKRLITALS